MLEKALQVFSLQIAQAFRLGMMRQVDRSGVLNEEHRRLPGTPLPGGLLMRVDDRLWGHGSI